MLQSWSLESKKEPSSSEAFVRFREIPLSSLHSSCIDVELNPCVPARLSRLYSRRTFSSMLMKTACLSALSGMSLLSTACSKRSAGPVGDNALSIPSAQGGKELVKASVFAFDTVVILSAYGPQACVDACVSLCRDYENMFSSHQEGADVWRINHAGGAWTEVHEETARLIQDSLEFSRLSQGRFDITVGSASLLWDFEKGVVPDFDQLKEAIKHIDYTKVEVKGNKVRLLDPEAMLDVGGTAKGWIADAFKRVYLSYGVQSGIINLGGNVYAVGEKPDGSAWNIAVRDPNNEGRGFITVVEVKDNSIVTSGLYERYIDKDGVRYTHILDTKTGLPAKTDITSVTVAGKSSFLCDGFSTTLFVDGLEVARDLINNQEGVEAIFINKEGKAFVSRHFEELYPQNLQSLQDNKIPPLNLSS